MEADPKAPELPEGWHWDALANTFVHTVTPRVSNPIGRPVTRSYGVDVLRALLSSHGLHIVSEADKRVLEACAAFPIEDLRVAATENDYEPGANVAKAELARRTP